MSYFDVARGKKEHAAARLGIVPNIEKAGLVSELIYAANENYKKAQRENDPQALAMALEIAKLCDGFKREFKIKVWLFRRLLERFNGPEEIYETTCNLDRKLNEAMN